MYRFIQNEQAEEKQDIIQFLFVKCPYLFYSWYIFSLCSDCDVVWPLCYNKKSTIISAHLDYRVKSCWRSYYVHWAACLKNCERLVIFSSSVCDDFMLYFSWPAWLSGRPSVSGQRSFAILPSACSWRVTTYVGKPSAIGQPTRPTQLFILSGSLNE